MKQISLTVLVGMFSLALTGCMYSEKVGCSDIALLSHKAVTPAKHPWVVDWYLPRHQAVLNRNKQGNVDMIMIGDSITYCWENTGKEVWQQYYGKRNAVNLGFGGDCTEQVLWRLENGEIDGINPKLAVVMIGTNNSGSAYTVEQVADGIKAIVCKLRSDLPKTKVLILAIFPKHNVKDIMARDVRISELASSIADDKMIHYLNINAVFLDDNGSIIADSIPDFLHLSEKGFRLWAEAMEPAVAELMNE